VETCVYQVDRGGEDRGRVAAGGSNGAEGSERGSGRMIGYGAQRDGQERTGRGGRVFRSGESGVTDDFSEILAGQAFFTNGLQEMKGGMTYSSGRRVPTRKRAGWRVSVAVWCGREGHRE
jgi:hypothetical protein